MKKILLSFCLILNLNLNADQNGVPQYWSESCASSTYSDLGFVCDILTDYFPGLGNCEFHANSCATGAQEIFTGVDLKPIIFLRGAPVPFWTQKGGRGSLIGRAALCSLRDLSLSTPVVANASASTLIGKATVKSTVEVTNFNPYNKSATGYHQMEACLPVVGCIDGFQQEFTVTEAVTSYTKMAPKVGSYPVKSTNALNLTAKGLNQQLSLDLPAFTVTTPYGPINAVPKFFFNRNLNAQMSPFLSGGVPSSMDRATTNVEGYYLNTLVEDIYGRMTGLNRSQSVSGNGWRSTIGLGSRDADPANKPWQQTGSFPALEPRPDLDFKTARSDAEKVPNFAMGSSVRIEYAPTDILPDALKNNSYITIDFKVFVEPIIGASYTSQFNFHSLEQHKRQSLSYQKFQMFTGASVATSFGIKTGIDLVVNLSIPIPFNPIDIDIINIHPTAHTPLLVRDDYKGGNKGTTIESSLVTQIPKKKLTSLFSFGSYVNPDRATEYINKCLSSPPVENPPPAPPSYKPGNPEDLTKFVEYPCNVCIGHGTHTYYDPKQGKDVTIESYLGLILPSDVNNLPPNLQWKCDMDRDIGCYDMCTYDVNKDLLTVVTSAKELVGKTCR